MSTNQSFEEQDQIPTQMEFIPFPPMAMGFHQSLKAISAITPSLSSEAIDFAETLLATAVQKPREDLTSSLVGAGGGGQQFSLNRSRVINPWAWGEVTADCLMGKRNGGGDDDHDHHHLGVSAIKMKKMKGRRKVREPRFCFKTMSDVDVLDDGYKWRKYGQKVVKNTQHPRYIYLFPGQFNWKACLFKFYTLSLSL
uniref:WRKY83 n=1 Tax=Glycyrrhiza glabra TaxID=49827 RepID=A0A7G3LRA0_GLYGL|nr:WRKY83 [Glycyrrhiza glabra]